MCLPVILHITDKSQKSTHAQTTRKPRRNKVPSNTQLKFLNLVGPIHIYIYIHTYLLTYIHTYIDIYIYIYISVQLQPETRNRLICPGPETELEASKGALAKRTAPASLRLQRVVRLRV